MDVKELRERIETTASESGADPESGWDVVAYGYGACLGVLASLHATDSYAAALIDKLFPPLQ